MLVFRIFTNLGNARIQKGQSRKINAIILQGG
jgi:hypothetical protein